MSVATAESLESRSYLNGVAFSPPINTSAASAGISPVNVDLESVYQAAFPDLVTANANNSVSILRGNGDGTFGPATTIPLDFSPVTMQAGTLGGNGQIDIVVGSSTGSAFGVILQTSAGQFTEQDYGTGLANTHSVAIGDFNGDGRLDIAAASDDGGTSNNVAIFLNDGSGGFVLSQTLSVPHADLASITTYAAGGTTHTVGSSTDLALADSADNEVTTLINNGSGRFAIGSNYSVGLDPVTIVDGQFELPGDHNDDLVTGNASGGSVSLLPGNGDGTFGSAVNSTVDGAAPSGGPSKVLVADLTPGFKADLVCLLSPGSSADAEALLSNGDGTFEAGGLVSAGGGTQSTIAAGDLNNDGLTDVVLANQTRVASLLNVTNENNLGPRAAVSPNQPSVAVGAATIDFTVTYSDAVLVETSTFGNGNLSVATPAGATLSATLVSTNLSPAQSVTVTYSIPAQLGSASQADNGTYTVTAIGNSVTNAGGVALAGGAIGQFTVAVVSPSGPNLVAGAVTVSNPTSAIAGTRFAGATRVTIVNSGSQTAKGKIVIDLYASPTQAVSGGTPVLTAATRAIDLRPGAKVVEVLPGFAWPTTPGTYYVVADVDATHTISETNFADNFGISARSTLVAARFVDIDNLWSGKLPAILEAGRRAGLAVALKNIGNTAARATAAFAIQAVDANNNATIIGTGSVRVAAPPNGRQVVSLPLTLPNTLAPGTYHLLVTVSYPGDSNTGNDTVTSATTFTV